MGAKEWIELAQWALWVVGIGLTTLIGAIVKLTLSMNKLTSSVNHLDDRMHEFKADMERDSEHVWTKLGQHDTVLGDYGQRITRLEPRGAR